MGKEFFWPSKPQLPSMILNPLVSGDKTTFNYVAFDTAMAREHLLLEYADAVKKVAMEMVEEARKVYGNSSPDA